MASLPDKGYLALPLRVASGKLQTCALDKSIERFVQLNLNVPLQGRDRPRWLPADPEIGCAVAHFDFDSVVRALYADASSLVIAIKNTVRKSERRVQSMEVDVDEIPQDDRARRRKDGSFHRGPMRRVTLRCRCVDGREQRITYDIAFAGPGPVFAEDEA